MILYCIGLGFTRIMMNPWPKKSAANGGGVVSFNYPECESAVYQVLLDFDHTTYEVIPDPENWYAGNQTKIDAVRAYKASIGLPIKILINYESAPQHLVLKKLELDHGTSRAAMNVAATQCVASPKDLHWCPPWTPNYDPLDPAIGTWNWIANRLGDMI